jgi:transcription termination factor Rho
MEDVPAIEFLLDKLRQSETNNEFFDSMRGGKAAKKK